MLTSLPARIKKFTKYATHTAAGVLKEYLGPREAWLHDNAGRHIGQTCIILGNGPSLKNVDQNMLRRNIVFGTNGVFLHHTPDYYVTVSKEYFKNHPEAIRALSCKRKFFTREIAAELGATANVSILNAHWNQYYTAFGFNNPVPFRFSSRAPRTVYLGGTVLFVCLQLAYHLGFTRVVLLGVDHRFPLTSPPAYGGALIPPEAIRTAHFHENYSNMNYTAHCDIQATERAFTLALRAFTQAGRTLLNATPDTHLHVIPKTNLQALNL